MFSEGVSSTEGFLFAGGCVSLIFDYEEIEICNM